MKVEVAITTYVQMDILEAMNGRIVWDYSIITGNFAQKYYLAEKDDIFLEIQQETLAGNGELHMSTLMYLECASLSYWANKQEVFKYISENKHRLINYQEIWEFE